MSRTAARTTAGFEAIAESEPQPLGNLTITVAQRECPTDGGFRRPSTTLSDYGARLWTCTVGVTSTREQTVEVTVTIDPGATAVQPTCTVAT